ncbi:MAG: hypothetical protein CVU77_02640 [Elusimicrobia bacterium HGW-Elusimicrobia-1]|jgi:uncharacterized membrane protein YraQ (UPF0718 family)|nr:MAG: hypothetical protein CVU77_02640 [Elusimicrobia bacterium HGW-Elusimicrobia-1]
MKKIIRAVAGGEYAIISLFALAIIVSKIYGFAPGDTVFINFWGFFSQMISILPLMFIVVGLFDVWIPQEKVAKHIGEGSGLKGIASVVLLASIQAGPLYGAFPVAYVMWKKGASRRNIFIYLGAYSTIKISMMTFEVGFLGLKFSLLRAALTLPVYIVVGFIMERYFSRDFKMESPPLKKPSGI